MDILFFADYWDDMWRRRQQLACRLARTDQVDRVIYIERPLPVTSFFKFMVGRADKDATDRLRRVRRNHSWLMAAAPKLEVLTTFAPLPPTGYPPLFRFSELARDRWLQSYLKTHCHLDGPMVWISHPQISAELIYSLEPRLLWYDCTEDFAAWPGTPPCAREQIQRTDRWLATHADIVTTVSRTLYAEKIKVNRRTFWLPNAVDTDLFLQARERPPVPTDLADAPHPVLAFVGGLGEWPHDWDLLDQIAALRPAWTILLIGDLDVSPLTLRMLKGHPNILCVGRKPYEQLPAYLAHSDICFQFYRSERGNDTRNSQKLFLYLAAGKPVISTPSADVEAYREYVTLASSAAEFVRGAEQALAEDSDSIVQERQSFAGQHSWNARVQSILSLLRESYPKDRLPKRISQGRVEGLRVYE